MTGERWIGLRNRAFWAFIILGLGAVGFAAAGLSTDTGWLGGIAGALAIAAFVAVLAYIVFAVVGIRQR
jgi:hypothetical protein